jgi:hypothetical protein
MLHTPMQLWEWNLRQYREVVQLGYLVDATLGRSDDSVRFVREEV